MDKEQAVEEARRVWNANVAPINELKKRIREEAEAQIEAETKRRRETAAKAIHEALEAGATKTSLRQVTTKDHWDFEAFIDLGEALSRGEDARYVSQRRVGNGLAK